MTQPFSIIIPAYNEEKQIRGTVESLLRYLEKTSYVFEILVVDDGSTDGSADMLKSLPVTLIQHRHNRGYGASIKSGVKESKYDRVLLYDADGQHTPEQIALLVDAQEGYDMVVGARQGYQGPWIRQPGKRLIKKVAEYLSEQKIPDFNSGLRIIDKALFNAFISLYPEGFSLTTTITIAALQNHYRVKYVPITVQKRQGTSTVGWRDALTTIMLVSRLIVLFSPLKLFASIASFLFLLGFASLIYDIVQFNLNELTFLLLISALLIFLFGLLADQISEIRRHLNK